MKENTIIESRLQQYTIQSKQDELNALKEIFQEIALSALARTDFFRSACFQGGTCLRIMYGLSRFSEDLDFILLKPNLAFHWEPYLKKIRHEFASYDLKLETSDRSSLTSHVKKAFLKEDSFGQILNLNYERNIADTRKIQIKLEIDINSPWGSQSEVKFLAFPYPFSLSLQDLESLFSGKCHALLCRPYAKGRDWFDFIWYVSRKTKLNYFFLSSALQQTGPWSRGDLKIDKKWIIDQLRIKILSMDWGAVKNDVVRFLKPKEAQNLRLWDKNFFMHMLEKMESYLD